MQEELNQFERNEVWELVPRPNDQSVIGTKWVYKNKMDENGIIIRNKARLVVQGYNQQEGIDYEETFCNTPKYTLVVFDMFRVFCKCKFDCFIS